MGMIRAQDELAPEEELAEMPIVEESHDNHAGHAHPNVRTEIKAVFTDILDQAGFVTVQLLSQGKPVALGTIVSSDGYILTLADLLDDNPRCRFSCGEEFPVKLVGIRKDYNLALVKFDAENLKPVEWWDGEPPEPGSWLVAQDLDGSALEVGVVGTEPRRVRGPRHDDASRGFLGVQLDNTEKGVSIRTVIPDTAASEAKLLKGDMVIGSGPETFKQVNDLIDYIGEHKAGEKIQLDIRRDKERMTVEVTLRHMEKRFRRRPDTKDRWGGGPFSKSRRGFPPVIQHDAAIPIDACGGPLFDTSGKCIGIHIARALRVTNYAVPSRVARKIVGELKMAGEGN